MGCRRPPPYHRTSGGPRGGQRGQHPGRVCLGASHTVVSLGPTPRNATLCDAPATDRGAGQAGCSCPAARTSGRAAIETSPRGPMLGPNGAQVDTRSLGRDPGSRIKDPGSLTRGSCIYPGYRNSDPGAMVAVGPVLCHAVSPWGCDLRNRRCRCVCGLMVRAFRQAKLQIKSAARPFQELRLRPRRCGGGRCGFDYGRASFHR